MRGSNFDENPVAPFLRERYTMLELMANQILTVTVVLQPSREQRKADLCGVVLSPPKGNMFFLAVNIATLFPVSVMILVVVLKDNVCPHEAIAILYHSVRGSLHGQHATKAQRTANSQSLG